MKDFSPHLARGLRCDLFRLVDDNAREDWQPFKHRQKVMVRRLGGCSWPSPGGGESA